MEIMSDGLPQPIAGKALALSLEQAGAAACRTTQEAEPVDMELVGNRKLKLFQP